MELEIGEYYFTRSWELVKIDGKDEGELRPFTGSNDSRYYANGNEYMTGPNEGDLVHHVSSIDIVLQAISAMGWFCEMRVCSGSTTITIDMFGFDQDEDPDSWIRYCCSTENIFECLLGCYVHIWRQQRK